MSDVGLVRSLAVLEEPVPVRPEFARALRDLLHAELGFGVAAAPAAVTAPVAGPVPAATPARPLDALRRALRSLWPATPRVAVLALLAVLLIAGTVVAGILVVRSWISSAPRGVQYTNDFTYAAVYREPGAQYDDLVLAPDGASVYGVRVAQWTENGSADPGAIVRFTMAADGGSWQAPVDVLGFATLRDPALWDAGTDLARATVTRTGGMVSGDGLSIAPDGSIVVGVTASEGWDTASMRSIATSLVVVRPDGTVQKVATGGELLAAGLLGDGAQATAGITGVASGPDWIWARAEVSVPSHEGFRLLEIVDPTHDGDWSDRVVRALVLPAEVPALEPAIFDRAYGPFVAEPSLDGKDRSRSILLPILERTGEVAIYRISDPDGDGDATDPGEADLLFSGTRPTGRLFPVAMAMTPRVVLDGSTVVLDEILVAGLSGETRISRITPAGVVDIMRGLGGAPDSIVAPRDGAIYVPLREPGAVDPATKNDAGVFVVGRLTPVPVGEQPAGAITSPSAPASPTSAPTVSPTPAPSPTPAATSTPAASGPAASPTPAYSIPPNGPVLPLAPLTPGVAVAAVALGTDHLEQAFLMGADGSGPALAVPATQVLNFCQSGDASEIAYQSADEVPGEYWLYVAQADGSETTKVSEASRSLVCPFPASAIVTYQQGDPLHRLYRHDLTTRAETEVVRGTVLRASGDGRFIALAGGDGGRTLQVLDVTTGAVRTLAGPFEQRVFAAWWSPSGDRVAYGVGPFSDCCDLGVSAPFDIRLVGLDGGGDRSLATDDGRLPEVSWSADAANVLVRIPTQGATTSEIVGSVRIVDVATGAARPVGSGDVVFAGWSPVDPQTYAYATPETLFVATLAGDQRKITDKPTGPPISRKARWPVGGWAGWSPDGTYIGLGLGDGCCEGFRVIVVEVATGTIRLLFTESETTFLDGWQWRRQPTATP
jgi:hypothetical protein